LCEQDVIPGRLIEMAQGIRQLRNIGAHADLGEIVEIDIQILTDFTEAILEYIYRAPVTHPTFEYHEKSSQEVAESEHNILVWPEELEIAIKEKAQADNKIRALESKIAAQEKKIASLEDQKQQIIESWNKQYKTVVDDVEANLNKIATTYVDQKVLPGKLKI